MISTLRRRLRHSSRAEDIAAKYQDLFFDLTSCVTFDAASAHRLFHRILRSVARRAHQEFAHQSLTTWERAAMLRLFCQELRQAIPSVSPHFANREQLELDAASTAAQRLKRLADFFKLLPRDEKIILALSDRHQVPMHEIAIALQIPEESVRYRHSRALVALESQIWREEAQT